ncbi:hypothetical protein S83_063158 [Arachis hypogaea]
MYVSSGDHAEIEAPLLTQKTRIFSPHPPLSLSLLSLLIHQSLFSFLVSRSLLFSSPVPTTIHDCRRRRASVPFTLLEVVGQSTHDSLILVQVNTIAR